MKEAFGAAGEVREVDLLAAFVALWREARSGSLRFSRGGAASAGFDLADGEITAISSSEARFETSAILVRAGKLDAAAVERLSVPPGSDGALAALAAGILTKREWKWGEKIRAIEILADLLSWPDGRYVFDQEARPARGEFTLTVPRLLLELFLRSRDRHLVEHQLGPTDAPLLRSAAFDEEFATFGLTADAESVVALIDGQASAMEISERAPAEEFAVLKLLAALKTLGLLRSGQFEDPAPAPLSAVEASEEPAPSEPAALEPWTVALSSADAGEPPAGETQNDGELADLPLATRASAGEPEDAPEASEERWRSLDPEAPGLDAREASLTGTTQPIWETPAAPPWEPPPEPSERGPAPVLESGGGDGPPGRRRPFLFGTLLIVLLLAVAATLLLKSWSARRETPRPALPTPAAMPAGARTAAAAAPTSRPTAAPAPTTAPAATASASRAPTARRPAASPAPSPRPSPARGAEETAPVPASGRSAWLERAAKDARRLKAEKRTRYAIQLELVCEVPSLAEAWKHDHPAGSMWVLTTKHGGRDCFRVLWGRYATIEEAKRAKSGIPPYFSTAANHPAVVGVR